MALTALSPYGKLIRNKLIALNVPAADADRMLHQERITHRWGPKKRDVEHLPFRVFLSSSIGPRWGLETAERIACVFHNRERSYHVDTTRLAMSARKRAA
jgi:hypothetical protein